ncbi:hypothetical protein ACLKA7_003010 [Drosophila subpalustris]
MWRGNSSNCQLPTCNLQPTASPLSIAVGVHFRDQSIDGTGLPLLTEDHLVSSLGMKLGPALKLRSILAKKLGGPCPCVACVAQAQQMLALQTGGAAAVAATTSTTTAATSSTAVAAAATATTTVVTSCSSLFNSSSNSNNTTDNCNGPSNMVIDVAATMLPCSFDAAGSNSNIYNISKKDAAS